MVDRQIVATSGRFMENQFLFVLLILLQKMSGVSGFQVMGAVLIYI